MIEKYILIDPIADINVRKITRGDIKDFKNRLIKKYGTARRINSILTVLKTVFRDGVDREVLQRDLAADIGKISYKKTESGVFTAKELAKLFPQDSLRALGGPAGLYMFCGGCHMRVAARRDSCSQVGGSRFR